MDRLTRLFPLLAIAAGVFAYAAPGVFAPFESAIVPLLIVIMFAMGLTLTVDDFRRVARRPAAVGLGVLLQYTVMPVAVVAAVVLHNLIGFAAGYAIPRWLGFDRLTCRTLSIEVGMQNSGLSVALAVKYFSPLSALPGAIFSIWHNIGGAVLAGYWASRPVEASGEEACSG